MTDCLFCKVIANEIPSHTVFEDGNTKAFLDIYGATDGHTLVLLKKHGETILEYTDEELKALWSTVKKTAAAVQKVYDTRILSIGINHGEPRGVHHLHVHIMPRYEGDGGGIMQSLPGRKLSNKNFAQVAKAIQDYLG